VGNKDLPIAVDRKVRTGKSQMDPLPLLCGKSSRWHQQTRGTMRAIWWASGDQSGPKQAWNEGNGPRRRVRHRSSQRDPGRGPPGRSCKWISPTSTSL